MTLQEPREWWQDPKRKQVHDVIVQVAYDQILADNPKFAPLYHKRKAWMLEEGYSLERAEREGHRFVCAEILLWIWCQGRGKFWIPHDPEDPKAHTHEMMYPDYGMA